MSIATAARQLYCPDDTRKALVRALGTLNGIDFLEVLDDDAPEGSPRQRTLLVRCLLPVAGLSTGNVRIDGGVRVTRVGVDWAHPASAVPSGLLNAAETAFLAALPQPDQVLVVRTDASGDFSTYRLRLILSPIQPDLPPAGFDPLLAAVDFSFKVNCPSEFDCKTEQVCPEPSWPAPQIDYLARDYASFRRLMLDRLAVTMPDWRERNPADLGIALVELLAYAADHLSYYQDAAATEAYLGTARRRVSVRRHARLVDYFVHDGANARAWACLEVEPGSEADGETLRGPHVEMGLLAPGTRLLSRDADAPTSLPPEELPRALSRRPVVFETLHDLRLSARRNAIPFHTWGDPRCCLPRGATRATLRGTVAELGLSNGDALLFEEVLGPDAGLAVHAIPSNRHVVRLNAEPEDAVDPLDNTPVVNISWHAEDALPFPLCLWQFPDGEGGLRGITVARGNVVLADHGLTLERGGLAPDRAPDRSAYRPYLTEAGLTQALPYVDETVRGAPASSATAMDPRRTVPAARLQGDGETWLPQRDLLASSRFAPEFVVEMEEDGRAYLRFGDGTLGRRPSAGALFTASYRVGSGSQGNVGAEALACVVTPLRGIERVRNPLPATGGTDPEPLDQVRLYAPQAFRSQERAVTEADYAAAAQRHPEVQRAAATRRWTGSWYTIFVTVDRAGGRPVDLAFQSELQTYLEPFRLAGQDLKIDPPRFVPLEIVLTVCVAPGYFRSNVKQALLEAFSNRDLPDGRRGFFHPDNFTFGQPVYLSQLVATAMSVAGVAWVDAEEAPGKPNRFRRWGQEAHGEFSAGYIGFGRLEIARLDNDPNAAENGRIDFHMQGGL